MLFDLPSAAATPAAKMRTAISVRLAPTNHEAPPEANRPREKFRSTRTRYTAESASAVHLEPFAVHIIGRPATLVTQRLGLSHVRKLLE